MDWQWTKQLNAPLEQIDPEIADIIELEKARQWKVFTEACAAYTSGGIGIGLGSLWILNLGL